MEKDKPKEKDSKGGSKDKEVKKKPLASPQQSTVLRRRQPVSKDFRGIIRIVGKDIDGHYKVSEALRRVKGIGHCLANALSATIQKDLLINLDTLVGDLTEEQMLKIEEVIKNPQAHGVPVFMLNRRKDYELGIDRHLLSTDLVFQTKQDIQREKDARSWIGWRHSLGQKVRGQHTRTTGRTGMTVGVVRKTLAPATAPGKAEEKK